MPIMLYNTLSRKKEVFKPIKPGYVGIYSCGPTVYWYQHIGNLRTYISNDMIKRVFLYNGFEVRHIINVTDVGHLTSDADTGDDKMENAVKREMKSAKEIAEHYFNSFREDLRRLNVIEPFAWPKATENVQGMIELIKTLEEKGYTYETSDGVYFDTSKLDDYGKLARLNIKELKAGKRVDLGEKKSKTDFALWKFSSSSGEKRQQEWESPWGTGFPGWHIECSVMSSKYLGKHFDIHTGGQEHIPVHHTNEIAQSEAAFGKKPWVNYWIHFAWLLFQGKKVSKSEGGLYQLYELEKKGFSPLTFRYLCLSTHYKKPLNFSLEILQAAQNSYQRLKNIVLDLKKGEKVNKNSMEISKKMFADIVNEDFNIPKGISFLWEILRDEKLNDSEKYELAMDFDKVLGLGLGEEEKIEVPKEVQKLIKERKEARKKKNWKAADEIRNRIIKLGYSVDDTDDGAKVRKL